MVLGARSEHCSPPQPTTLAGSLSSFLRPAVWVAFSLRLAIPALAQTPDQVLVVVNNDPPSPTRSVNITFTSAMFRGQPLRH